MPSAASHGTVAAMDERPERWFLVERYVPALRPEGVGAAVDRLEEGGDATAVHLWTVLIPDEETCLSVFRAVDRPAVMRANERAGFLVDRVVEIAVFRGAGSDPRGGRR